jgi:aminoglycoside phosphotransferase family enzyme
MRVKKNSSVNSTCQATLIEALTNPVHYPHPAAPVVKLETHISYILLAGNYAYKIKKALNLGFLDFTSLDRRKVYCTEELRLNRRLAPELYLDCIPISGSEENPILDGDPATAIEYAVKMRRFSQQALLDQCLQAGILETRHIDALARQLAEFHGSVVCADLDTSFGTPEQVHQPVLENFTQTRALLKDPEALTKLTALERWSVATYERLKPTLAARKAEGFIRECHGDLHLGNMILQDDQITIFDCIEFNDNLRWIDTMSDLGFLVMDLHRRGAISLAWRLLNGYLEFSGDYGGLVILPYYQIYRAMVRAKIASIRLHQPDLKPPEQVEIHGECCAYLELALSFTRSQPPFLLITHGVSGSGKTYITSQLLQTLRAIRIRSDVERKRLFGLGPLDSSGSVLDQGIYSAEAGVRTYERLKSLAEMIIDAGYPVIVDATFLEFERRQYFRELAQQKRVPFVLLCCRANPKTLRARVAERQALGEDAAEANLAVLERQLQAYLPPSAEENPLKSSNGDIDVLQKEILTRVNHQRQLATDNLYGPYGER